MPEQLITIRLAVPLAHTPGDYIQIHSNNGSGDIDYDTPYIGKKIPLFPGGSGNFGFGHGPFGKVPFGKPYQKNIRRGFGTQPFGRSPFGIGTVMITETVHITECGDWKFALLCYDKLGNVKPDTPAEAAVSVHVAPTKASALEKVSYDKNTDVLTLAVVNPFNNNSRLGNLPSRLDWDLTGTPFEGFAGTITGSGGQTESTDDPNLPLRISI